MVIKEELGQSLVLAMMTYFADQ